MHLLPNYKACNEDYDTFISELKNKEFMRGIDNQPDLNDDEAYDIAQTFWNEVSSNAND